MSNKDRFKRYILFAGDQYYPGGGIDDFRGTFDTAEEAKAAAKAGNRESPTYTWHYDWWQVVDRETLKEVE